MKKNILDAIKTGRLWFDGGTGSMLQSLGLPPGEAPEAFNLKRPDLVEKVHRAYIEAGCRIITTNTFGVSSEKYSDWKKISRAAVGCVKSAAAGRDDVYIAFDIGPSGRLLEPLGDLAFEDAVKIFADSARAAEKEGADLILIETMNDCYETKAALLAAKENTSLPVFVTNVYDESCRLLTGATPEAMAALLEGMGADAIGVNCSLGPELMLPVVKRLSAASSVPVIASPNAGMPALEEGVTKYDVSPADFAAAMRKLVAEGATVPGGCCGTTPDHLRAAIAACRDIPYVLPERKEIAVASSFSTAVVLGKAPVLIGERINPTGKPRLKQALKSGDESFILSEALAEEEAGAEVLDVNVGLPGTDEAAAMRRTVVSLQTVTGLPLQLDSASPAALEAGMRIYNGKPMVNSVDGSEAKMAAVFPLVKKYGGLTVALTMDDKGIPGTAAGRVEIAERIVRRAAEYGIGTRDLVFDPLTLSVSAEAGAARVTLDTVALLHARGFHTLLGISNVSFGLPERDTVNAAFFSAALEAGLSAAIMNPFSSLMTGALRARMLFESLDPGCKGFVEWAAKKAGEAAKTAPVQAPVQTGISGVAEPSAGLRGAICSGLREKSAELAAEIPGDRAPVDVINEEIIPALNLIGQAFEEKRLFLPQLLMSAEAASAAFAVLRERMPAAEADAARPVILATVKGDIHDIGK
ncbi:MAG: homocysteine S-methyltransferase family protein, partial [Clostridia bacterium]|nr:homocysteine S-methyltransferase family protein [Clostridia bacterium]